MTANLSRLYETPASYTRGIQKHERPAPTMTLATQSEFFADAAAPVEDSSVRDELISVVAREWADHPRSLQAAIGPSEVGVACARQLAAKLAGAERVNAGGDLLPAWIGTAGHAKLEAAFAADNARLVAEGNAPRWIIEQRVEVAIGLSGSCDVFDVREGRAIDHKFLGANTFREYRKNGPPRHYVVQAMCYGAGWVRAGYAVREVAIWMIPRAGTMAGSHLWSAPFDQAVADAAVDRLNLIRAAVDGFGAAADHTQLNRVPATPGLGCRFCPVFSASPTDSWSCSGT